MPIMRRSLWSISFFILLLFTLSAHSVVAEDALGKKPTLLRIAGWDVYADPINRGKTIGYKSAERQLGITIEFTPLSHLDEIIDAAESNNDYDILIISNEGIKILGGMGLISPLSLSQIPNYQDLHHSLRYTEWGQIESKTYAVPWAWGPTGLLYDTTQTEEPESWNILWDERFSGQISLWNDVSLIWITALSLGYDNVYNLTRFQLDNVRNKLLNLNQRIFRYYDGEVDAIDSIINGEAVLLNSWFDPSARLLKHKRNFRMAIPKEGAVGMFDSYLISRNSRQNEIAHRFINHQLSPIIQREMVQITGLAPANNETMALLSADEIHALHLGETDYFNRMILWDVMPRKQLYEELLSEIRSDFQARKSSLSIKK
ncbi:hypothetical protein BOW53_13025 [Solemya pervernicosa gill symbiont]|uniref:Spermidine/putrescine ABC transporter substrate-binding protein n=3 Tax=Gammaproteobacteria incertae sedis TaxID=118884 RepID=A0A1T2L1W8_9GAMM|nr:hypothetical protein BOW53_13025 [Solemya pervernicosa gill symbiont]